VEEQQCPPHGDQKQREKRARVQERDMTFKDTPSDLFFQPGPSPRSALNNELINGLASPH
jgi:hypothetical protein